MINESYILRIVREDILRILAEVRRGIPLDSIKKEVKISSFFISKVLKELDREKLIETKENLIKLTKIGQEKSKNILRKHLVLENYFKRSLNKKAAHRKAHILEHYISEEVTKNIDKLYTLKEIGIPLTKCRLQKNSLIADIITPDYKLFERIVSMGIYPGEKIDIVSITPSYIVIKIKNKKFVLSKSISKILKVLKYEKT
ncbi:MAG: FeoA domain-containing protein [Ignavibacteriales bacterium]|nr:FeoA domain-containing protein [Ignavibacteriales bacterium]